MDAALQVLRAVNGTLTCAILLATLAIMRLYYEVHQRRRERGSDRGLLPRHVWVISGSYSVLAILAVIPHSVLGPWLRQVIVLLALVAGVYALWTVYKSHTRLVVEDP